MNLAIQSHKNTRQRRMISKESRARELAKSEEERAQRMQRAREVEVEEWKGKFYARDQEAFDQEVRIGGLEHQLEEAAIVRARMEKQLAEQQELVDTATSRMEVLTTLRDEASAEIARLSDNLAETRTKLDKTKKQYDYAERERRECSHQQRSAWAVILADSDARPLRRTGLKEEEALALSARVQALSIAETENEEQIRHLTQQVTQEHERAEMYKQTLADKEGQLLGEIEALQTDIDDLHAANGELQAECKRLAEALLIEKERATVKMSGWMEDNFDMKEIEMAPPPSDDEDNDDDLGEGEDGARVGIVARPQELVDEMEKLLASAVADKVRLQREVEDEKAASKRKEAQMQQEAAERETRAQAMFASLRKQLDEAKAKERQMHEQLMAVLEEKEEAKRKGLAESNRMHEQMHAAKVNDGELEQARAELHRVQQAADTAERESKKQLTELQRALNAEERKSKALENELGALEGRCQTQVVAAETALDNANARIKQLELQLG